jgi:hypothetical protein
MRLGVDYPAVDLVETIVTAIAPELDAAQVELGTMGGFG